MSDPRATPDLIIAETADRQHGVVSIAQIQEAGLDKHQVLHRVRTARLHRIHRGVFAVGHSHLSQEGKWIAATLAGGDLAVLSHRSAASLWALLPSRETSDVEISVPGDGGRRKRAGIRVHRCPSLDLCRKYRLPTPEVNARIDSLLVDFVWRNQKLIVETDGYRYHRGRVAFEDDRARDLKLRASGYYVIRLTHRQVMNSPEEVFAILKKTLVR